MTKPLSPRTQKLEKFIVYFTLFYVSIFAINALVRGNVEFVYYTAVMALSIGVILFINKRLHFYPIVLISLSLLGLLHMLGGNYYIGTVHLYDFYLLPNIFRYDNFVHMVGSGIMVMLAYAMLKPVLLDSFERQTLYFGFLLVLVGMGLGAINELIEFFAVLVFDASKTVGDYTNTLLDITFNTIGSIITAIILVKTKIPLVEIPETNKPLSSEKND
ncbi:MAG: DUF2238 domain-containing protein [Patescibacteria group bacterium]|jgi:putative membrane protein